MRTRPDRAMCLGALLSLMIVTAAMACRYTVRDIGFVRLSPPTIRLVLLDAVHDDAAIAASLADLPLELVEVDSSHDPDHPACIALQDTGRSAVLLAEDGRALPIEDPLSIGRSPLAVALATEAATTFAFVLLLESSDEAANAIARAELDQLQGRLDAIEEHLPRPLGHPLRIRSLAWASASRERILSG